MTTTTFRALFVSAAALLSCRGSDVGPGVPGKSAASAMLIVAGNDQSGIAGDELSDAVIVQVVDSMNEPVPGQIVNFRVTAGGGSVFAGVAMTDANGLARERWTLGTVAGPQKLEARAVDSNTGAALVFASFTATALAGAPASVSVAAGDGQSGQQHATLANPITAHVADRYGNAVAGTSVTFAPEADNGYASPNSVNTDPNGNASTMWTLGRPIGAQVLEASVSTLPVATFGATATAAAVQAQLVLVSGDSQAAAAGSELAAPIVIMLRDLSGAGIAGQPVTFSSAAGSGSPVTPSATTGADGTAETRWLLGPIASEQQLTVTATDPVTGQAVIALAVKATAIAGRAATVSVLSGDGQSEISRFTLQSPLAVRVTDAHGNVVPNAAVTFVVTSGGGKVSPPTSNTSTLGVASTTWTLGPAAGGQAVEARLDPASPAVFTATALQGGPYDGAYSGTRDGCDSYLNRNTTSVKLQFTVRYNLISWCAAYPASCSIAADGTAVFAQPGGMHMTPYFTGTFAVDAAGGSTGSGTYLVYDPSCAGTWAVTRD